MNELIRVYGAGILLGCFALATGKGDSAECSKAPWIGYIITTLGWPILIPMSFYALIGNTLWGGLRVKIPYMTYPE